MSYPTPGPDDAQQSVKRVRRGCLGVAALVAAMAVLFTSATGNLFFLTLLLIALGLVVLSRLVN